MPNVKVLDYVFEFTKNGQPAFNVSLNITWASQEEKISSLKNNTLDCFEYMLDKECSSSLSNGWQCYWEQEDRSVALNEKSQLAF